MNYQDKKNCDGCCHNGRVVKIVAKTRFSGEQLSFFLEEQTGARCFTFLSLEELAQNDNERHDKEPLILLEANQEHIKLTDKLCAEVIELTTRHHLLAIFNTPKSAKFEKDALSCGIRGIFHEDDPAQDLIKGVCSIFQGEIWVSRQVMTECFLAVHRDLVRKQYRNACSLPLLTVRQKTILSLIGSGASNQRIADELCISPHTVKTHIYNIFKKIKVPSRTQAALWAAKNL